MDDITEKLFLLEFLVDKVTLDPDCPCTNIGETCVSFQFLDNTPLDICEADFSPKREYRSECDGLKSGKSCLFSLTGDHAKEVRTQFDVYVKVFKKMPCGTLPDKVQVGNLLISIVELFNELLCCCSQENPSEPAAKTLKDTFKISDSVGETVGSLTVYIRMSCFGKLIVTQFQMNVQEKSVLFKDKGGNSLYRYKKSERSSMTMKKGSECPRVPCSTGAERQVSFPCNECFDQPDPVCKPAPAPAPCSAPPPPAAAAAPPPPPAGPPGPSAELDIIPPGPGCYQEIGAEMGGNTVTIRVYKDDDELEVVPSGEDGEGGGGCSCTPASFAKKRRSSAQGGQQETTEFQPKSPMTMKMGCGNNITICPPNCTNPQSAFAQAAAIKAAQQPQQPPQKGGCTPCSPRISLGGGSTNGGGNGSCTPANGGGGNGNGNGGGGEQNEEEEGGESKFPVGSNPEKDVFILRIGKKKEGKVNKKNNIELGVVTPKAPVIKPKPKKETRDAQWNEADAEEAYGGPLPWNQKPKKPKKKKNGKKKKEDKCAKETGGTGGGGGIIIDKPRPICPVVCPPPNWCVYQPCYRPSTPCTTVTSCCSRPSTPYCCPRYCT